MIEKLINQLEKVKRTGNNRYIACCPVHNDKNPSLSITEHDGKVLLNCFGCGAGAHEIVEALGLSLNDLFSGDTDYYSPPQKVPLRDVLECLKDEIMIITSAALRVARGGEVNEVDRARILKAAAIIENINEDVETRGRKV